MFRGMDRYICDQRMPLIEGILNSEHILVGIREDFLCKLADTSKLLDHLFVDIDYLVRTETDDMDLYFRSELLKSLDEGLLDVRQQ